MGIMSNIQKSVELAPCPFCGADAEIAECADTHAGEIQKKWFTPKCFWDNCLSLNGMYGSYDDALEAWNTRQDTNSDEVREVLELLEMEAKKVKELRARERKLLGVLDVALGDYQEYKAAAILNELKALNTLPTTKSTEWIAVSERLPKHDEPIVYLKFDGHKNGVGIAYRTVSNEWNPWDFTHWIPLPTPPEAK
mgnify:CR=1 FL=1